MHLNDGAIFVIAEQRVEQSNRSAVHRAIWVDTKPPVTAPAEVLHGAKYSCFLNRD
jgi:hypothetical protein